MAGRISDEEGVGIPVSCATLFNKDHKPVVSTKGDDDGRFAFRMVPDGTYVLVVGYTGFTPALAAMVVDHKRGSSKSIDVKMVLSRIDTCSTIDFHKK